MDANDILEVLVRMDYIKLLVAKRRPLWLAEAKKKQEEEDERDRALNEIMFGSDDEDEDEDDYEDDEDQDLFEGEALDLTDIEFVEAEEKQEELPCLPDDFEINEPTPEELTEQRINNYVNKLQRVSKQAFDHHCVQQGVMSENEVFDTIGVVSSASPEIWNRSCEWSQQTWKEYNMLEEMCDDSL